MLRMAVAIRSISHLKCGSHLSPLQIRERAVEALVHNVPFHRRDDQRLDAAVVAHGWPRIRCAASRARAVQLAAVQGVCCCVAVLCAAAGLKWLTSSTDAVRCCSTHS